MKNDIIEGLEEAAKAEGDKLFGKSFKNSSLDKIGELNGLCQHSGETEDEFRERIKTKFESLGRQIRDEHRASVGSFCHTCACDFKAPDPECETCQLNIPPSNYKQKDAEA